MSGRLGLLRSWWWLAVPGLVAVVAVVVAVADDGPDAPAVPDLPDPFVLLGPDGRYHAYATNDHDTVANVQYLRSHDGEVWRWEGDALPELPEWASPGMTWSPSVLERGGSFVLYYSAVHAFTGLHCIGRAVAAEPAGPFHDGFGEPLVCQDDQRGVIDPSPIVGDDGRPYLLWKTEGRFGGVDVDPPGEGELPMRIWAQPLDDDGVQLIGDRVVLIDADQPWEGGIVEGPSMVSTEGHGYVLFYSGNLWSTPDYAIGWARCATPLGPCEKPASGPLLASRGRKLGPGNNEVFIARDGSLHIVYHAWYGDVGYPDHVRAMHVARLELRAGEPVLRDVTEQPVRVEGAPAA